MDEKKLREKHVGFSHHTAQQAYSRQQTANRKLQTAGNRQQTADSIKSTCRFHTAMHTYRIVTDSCSMIVISTDCYRKHSLTTLQNFLSVSILH
jgi:hypothetical protein